MSEIKKAVILAAGLGSRLRPLTDEVPKCLTEVNGKPILEQTLIFLEKNGIEEAAIVVGYLGREVIDKFGRGYGNVKLSYLWNDIYDETNTMYSAWLARKYLEKGAILIEGDTVFEEALLKQVLETSEDKAYWVVDRFTPEYDGSMSITDTDGRIIDLKIVRGKLKEYSDHFYKSTGILKIPPEYGRLFSEWLDGNVKAGNVQMYYDLVIAKHLRDAAIYVCDITGKEWMEIDSVEDLKKTEKIFIPTKYVIIIIGGAADDVIRELGDKTPLEYANIPNMDLLTLKGHTGLMRTMYADLPIGSVVANLGILGYNPLRYYPNGRTSFEALAQEIYLQEDEIAFRCNLVSLDNGYLKDFTANNISDNDAKNIIENIETGDDEMTLYTGQSYRNILIVKAPHCNPGDIVAFEPHMNIGKKIDELQLKTTSEKDYAVVDNLNKFMLESISMIKKINKKVKSHTDMLFLWSPSTEPHLPSFHRKYGIDGAIISGVDFLRGIGIAARMENRKISGATGYSDTDLKAKLRSAINSLRYNDLVFVHANAPDEESHNQNVKGKVRIIEKIDRELIGPMKEYLDKSYKNKYRFAILPDHYTLLSDGKHSDKLVPFVIYGQGIKRNDVATYCEKSVSQKTKFIIKSYEFMDFFINREGGYYDKY
jgi:2,3-bisphosphoglycerate-independent phosphoglycerate mutase